MNSSRLDLVVLHDHVRAMRVLVTALILLIGPGVSAQTPSGLRKMSHGEIVELVEDSTVLFADKGEVVHEYHGTFKDGVAKTAYRDWNKVVREGRLILSDQEPGLVCYNYTNDYDNCAFYIHDESNDRIYVEFVDTVAQQTVQVLEGDRLNLQRRIQVRYRGR